MALNFEALKEYFDALDQRLTLNGNHHKQTKVGLFAPSSLAHINSAIEQLIAAELIDPSRLFLDTGGDGRIIALTAGVFGIPSMIVEYDGEIADRAERNIRHLRQQFELNGTPMIVARGDFTHDKTYYDAGVRFEDIATVFNYASNEKDIAEKIARQSPNGTKFLLYGIKPPAPEFKELTLEQSLTVVDPSVLVKGVDWTDPYHLKWVELPYTSFLYVYRK